MTSTPYGLNPAHDLDTLGAKSTPSGSTRAGQAGEGPTLDERRSMRPPWRAWLASRRGRVLSAGLVAYLVLVHLGLGFALTQTDMVNRALLKLGLVPKAEFTPEFMADMGRLIAADRAAPEGAIVFLGDSHLRRLNLADLPYPNVNLSASGETSARLLARLAHYRSLRDARAIVLGVGINDLMYRDPKDFALNMEQAIHLLPENVPLVVKGVMLVDERAQRLLHNEDVVALNRTLEALCAAREHCLFVDVTPMLDDGSGNLATGRHVGDGIHLKDDAEALLREWMAAGIDEVLEPETKLHP